MRFKKIYVDVDGTLCKGLVSVKEIPLVYGYESLLIPIPGEYKLDTVKQFHCRDLQAALELKKEGVEVHIISGSKSNSDQVEFWAKEAGIEEDHIHFVYGEERLKLFTEMTEEERAETALVGDDYCDSLIFDFVEGFVPSDGALIARKHPNATVVDTKGGEGVLMDVFSLFLMEQLEELEAYEIWSYA